MQEIEQVKARTKPAEVLLVADAMTGQEAVNIAESFNKRVGLTGLILTKVDGDARGGAAISMRAATGVPIKFLGMGEKPDAFEQFHPDRLAQRILGMGDVMTLIEKAQAGFDEAEASEAAERMLSSKFDLEDFLKQMQQVKKLGPLHDLMGMIPGMRDAMKDISPSQHREPDEAGGSDHPGHDAQRAQRSGSDERLAQAAGGQGQRGRGVGCEPAAQPVPGSPEDDENAGKPPGWAFGRFDEPQVGFSGILV